MMKSYHFIIFCDKAFLAVQGLIIMSVTLTIVKLQLRTTHMTPQCDSSEWPCHNIMSVMSGWWHSDVSWWQEWQHTCRTWENTPGHSSQLLPCLFKYPHVVWSFWDICNKLLPTISLTKMTKQDYLFVKFSHLVNIILHYSISILLLPHLALLHDAPGCCHL